MYTYIYIHTYIYIDRIDLRSRARKGFQLRHCLCKFPPHANMLVFGASSSACGVSIFDFQNHSSNSLHRRRVASTERLTTPLNNNLYSTPTSTKNQLIKGQPRTYHTSSSSNSRNVFFTWTVSFFLDSRFRYKKRLKLSATAAPTCTHQSLLSPFL